jgi:hypothetical protein
MSRRSDSYHEKLKTQKLHPKPGPQRELLLRKLNLIKTSLRIDDWASSAGLRAPE